MGQLDSRPDGVDTYPADQHDLESYALAEKLLSQLQVPVLLHVDNPHERLYIAALDGTGNSMFDDAPENWSAVAKIHEQVHALEDQGIDRIRSGYVEGTFTQDNPIARYVDGVIGYTFERRVETAYDQFCKQAKDWLREDPDAQIRIVGVGFSRGAEEVAALHRMIEERGIQDPEDAKYTYYKGGLIKEVEYTKPLLVPPGQTVQVAMLFDPVATGVKEHDRRLPSTLMSGLQITAEDERRDQFESTDLLKPGFSEGNRFFNVNVGGVHSNIGNTYTLNGLGIRSENLGILYLNALSERPFLSRLAVPDDPALNVVHRSDQHSWIYTERGYRDGIRDHHHDLAPRSLCRNDARACTQKEPFDPEMDRQLERRGVPVGPAPRAPASETDRLFDRLHQASLSDDNRAMHMVGDAFLRSPEGRGWQQDVREYAQATEAREQQAAREAQQRQVAEQASVHRPHAMRM